MALTTASVVRAVDETRDVTLLGAGKHGAAAAGIAAGNAFGIPTLATAMTVGLTSAVSAGVVQLDHHIKMKRTAKFYKEELAAKLGKNPKDINIDDMELAAKGSVAAGLEANPVMEQEIRSSKKKRNFGVVLSIAASVLTLAILGIAIPGAEGLASGAGGLAAKAVEKGFVEIATKALVGVATYFAVKAPLHWVSDKLFHIDEATAHDRIEQLQLDREAGKAISKEQVFAVFVAANPELDNIIRKKYRKSFDDLDLKDKQVLTHDLGKLMQITEITDAINSGNINVSELAFASVGQYSGVPMKDGTERERPHGLLGAIKEKWQNITEHFGRKHEGQEPYAIDDRKPARSFAERIGRRSSQEMSHLERLEQARAEGVLPHQR